MGKRLYVGNLPYDTDEAGLRTAFGQDGRQVANVHLVMDRETGRPRGFAFVEMNSEDDAKKAITAMDGAEFGGRRLRVNEAEDRRGPPRAGGGPGGPGGPGGDRRPAPRPFSAGGGGGYQGGAGGGGGYQGGGGAAGSPGAGQGGSGGPSRTRNWTDAPPAEPKKYDNKKTRRKHDEDEDYGGRRGARRFDDDDEW